MLMTNKLTLPVESRMQGDLHVRFGGRLWETYHRKVVRRPSPSLHVTYADSLEHTNYFLPDMSSIRPDTIYLNEVSQTHLIAPEKVIYIDYGDTCIQVSKAENTENIVRMIAATGKVEEFPRQTNVSLATEGGKFYTFSAPIIGA